MACPFWMAGGSPTISIVGRQGTNLEERLEGTHKAASCSRLTTEGQGGKSPVFHLLFTGKRRSAAFAGLDLGELGAPVGAPPQHGDWRRLISKVGDITSPSTSGAGSSENLRRK